ncbi:EAL domain-containing protein [Sphingomonas morindae]|uniref:EAL domain-containing protein n=1 Tax=Sphingomonas morindae TaxID=1541170 RepID=A0ABY4X3A6_9SPHN|nr:EAL domain-containing protein [Sphingomonas morindae]USI71379.1 EAL domain-containing protein [Sphingomonas morindae]
MLFGLVLLLPQPREQWLRQLQWKLHDRPASNRMLVVEIDDRTLEGVGQWPIPRGTYARLLDRLYAMGAARVFFDLDFSSVQTPGEDDAFAAALRRHAAQTAVSVHFVEDGAGNRHIVMPIAAFASAARLALMNVPFDESGHVWDLPLGMRIDGHYVRGGAAEMAGIPTPAEGLFPVDGSVALRTIPHVALIDVLRGTVPAKRVAGRAVIVGANSEQVPNYFLFKPYGRIATIFIMALGAETLLDGVPTELGALPLLTVAAALALAITLVRRRAGRIALLAALAIGLPLLAVLLPPGVYMSVVPALGLLLVMLLAEIIAGGRELMRRRGTTNAVSGLANLSALRALPNHGDHRLVVAHVHNFADAIATLPASAEAELIEQIAGRLRLGAAQAELYQGDNGVFAWLAAEEAERIGDDLNALHALFRTPVTVGGQPLDLSLTFGVDDDGSRSLANRLGSALVAAGEAAVEGGKWRLFDSTRLVEAAWKLSLLSQLDAAIDDGHIWVAYQPKLDLLSRRLIGAEALVRWTHPEKGAISPLEFVSAAEQHNRIEKLTRHVLERAVLAAATINAHGFVFGIAVNLSARLLESRDLVAMVDEALRRHALSPSLLTLEITETATLTSGRSLEALNELRALGVRISIDDYGTGLSTLEYLKKIPASEIKIDRVFVQSMLNNSSDLLMVNSTIQLGHSLGHAVVAEGVESEEVLIKLADLHCDIAQGFHIGRPMSFQDLARRLLAERRQAA